MNIKITDTAKTKFEFHHNWLNENVSKWKERTEGSKHPEQLALILDNQTLFIDLLKHQARENAKAESEDNFTRWFYENSVEIVRRVVSNLPVFDLVSLQAMKGPVGITFYNKLDEDGQWQPHEYNVAAKTRMLKIRFNVADLDEDLLVKKFRNEINDEILWDLRNNCGKVGQTGDLENLHKFANHLREKKRDFAGNEWLVVGPKLARELISNAPMQLTIALEDGGYGLDSLDELTEIGVYYHRWRVYVDPNALDNEVLCGCAGEDGYVYCPYILFGMLDGLEDGKGVITRYGKRLISASHFGKLWVNNS